MSEEKPLACDLVVDKDGQVAPQHLIEFYAYETIGYTPPNMEDELRCRLEQMLRESFAKYVGRNVTPELLAEVTKDCTTVMQLFHPSITVEAIPDESNLDKLLLRITSTHPTVTELLRRIP